MNKPCTAYYYVTHKETQEQGYRIADGKYAGVVWKYNDVKFPMYGDDGEMVDPELAESIPLTFGYDILYNPSDEDLSTGDFGSVIGDILLNVIEESLEHDQINIDTKNRTDNTDEFDS